MTTRRLDYYVNVVTPDFFTGSTTLANGTVDCLQNVTIFNEYVDQDSARERFPATDYERHPMWWADVSVRTINKHENTSQMVVMSNTKWYTRNACNVTKGLLDMSVHDQLKRLDARECVSTFGNPASKAIGQGDVLVVAKEQPGASNATILLNFRNYMYASNYTGRNWVCDPAYLVSHDYRCNVRDYLETVEEQGEWFLGPVQADENNDFRIQAESPWSIDYCLVKPVEFNVGCQLQYSLVIMLIVLACNAIKVVCILVFLFTSKEPVIATIGDGIASFLARPDMHTKHRPFMNRSAARAFRIKKTSGPVRWYPPRHALRWFRAPSWPRWVSTITLYVFPEPSFTR